MGPKKNAKATAANARKESAEAESKAKEALAKEQVEETSWQRGSKDNTKTATATAKRKELLDKKAEREGTLY
jgi:hypothetical protein